MQYEKQKHKIHTDRVEWVNKVMDMFYVEGFKVTGKSVRSLLWILCSLPVIVSRRIVLCDASELNLTQCFSTSVSLCVQCF